MSYPNKVTVGALLTFLQEELKKGNVDSETEVFVEIYSLTPEEEKLKARQGQLTEVEQIAEELDYHIPDDVPDDIVHFRMGVWQGFPDGQSRSADGKWANTVALSICAEARRTYSRRSRAPIKSTRLMSR